MDCFNRNFLFSLPPFFDHFSGTFFSGMSFSEDRSPHSQLSCAAPVRYNKNVRKLVGNSKHTLMDINMNAHTYIHIYMHTYIHSYTSIHTHTQTREHISIA